MLDTFIQQLTKEMELEGSLATQVAGVFSFPIDDNVYVTITDRPPGFTLNCTLCAVPKHHEEGYLTRMMLGNLFGQGTKGAILGLDGDTSHLTLSQAIDYNIDYKEFRDTLEDFTNTVDFWREEMEKYRAA